MRGRNSNSAGRAVIRYWGSHFKTPRQVAHWLSLFAPLRARGWRCCLVLEKLPENRTWLAELEGAGVELVCLSRPRGQIDWDCIRQVRALCRRFRADVFHCENIHTSPMIGAWLARVPMRLWQKHSMFIHYEECRQAGLKERFAFSTRLTCGLATKVLAVSSSVGDELIRFGISQKKVLVRNNPRTAMPGANRIDRAAARKLLGLAESDVVIASLGHAVPVKGWHLLLESFVAVARSVAGAKLVLVGSHSAPAEAAFSERLRSFIATNKMADRVLFTGHVLDITPALRAADIFVMPSLSEGFSHALIEAMEEGKPCVAAKVGIAPEVVQDGVNGYLVERGDVAGFSQALLDLVSNREKRESFARQVVVPACIPTLEEYAEQFRHDYDFLSGRLPVSSAAVVPHPA